MRESNPIPTASGSRITRRVRLGLVEVALRTDEPGLLDYLADFYTITDEAVDGAAWTVDARLGDEAGMHRNPWGVAFDADEREKVLRVRAESVLALAMTTRKALREGLVQYCEQRRYVMLHASAFADDHRVVLVVGRKGSGKTTLALKAALSHDCHYLSNDHAMIYLEPGSDPQSHRLAITSLPTPIPLKIGTYLDLEDSLPSPWEIIDLPERRGLSVARGRVRRRCACRWWASAFFVGDEII